MKAYSVFIGFSACSVYIVYYFLWLKTCFTLMITFGAFYRLAISMGVQGAKERVGQQPALIAGIK